MTLDVTTSPGEGRLRCWSSDESGRRVPRAGVWDLVWDDGIFVTVHKLGKVWRVAGINPTAQESDGRPHLSRIPLPETTAPTRRELIEILRQWRRLESQAQ